MAFSNTYSINRETKKEKHRMKKVVIVKLKLIIIQCNFILSRL